MMRIIHISNVNKTDFDRSLEKSLSNILPNDIINIMYSTAANNDLFSTRYSVLIILKNKNEPTAATMPARNSDGHY